MKSKKRKQQEVVKNISITTVILTIAFMALVAVHQHLVSPDALGTKLNHSFEMAKKHH
jgi:hypothetical protein